MLKYQTRDSAAGVDVVTPLVTADGSAVLVDRGWLSTENSGASRPASCRRRPTGQVTVTGWVRRDATGGATRVSQLSTRAVSSSRVAERPAVPALPGLPRPRRRRARPRPTTLKPTELPDDTSNGPHFFYGLQWWFFGALAVFGFCYLRWDEWRSSDRRSGGRSERPEHAAVDGQHRRR